MAAVAVPIQDVRDERTARRRTSPVVYPTRDGKPMAETDKHADLMVYAKETLRLHYADRRDSVYVSGNNFLYYEEGNPQARISPDTYVVFGVEMRQRDFYKVWEEGGHLPSVVFEFTSRKTRGEDTGRKFSLYERVLKVPEYFLFDPTSDYLSPRLQGYRLGSDGRYRRIPLQGGDRLYSEQLGLELVIQGDQMRFFDPVRKRYLPSLGESEAMRAAEAQALAEAESFAQSETARAAAESVRAAAEAERAEAESKARQEAEDENARLRAELEALREQMKNR